MSEEGGHESFLLWENQSWAALSNSDNNSGGTADSEEKSDGKNQQEQEPLLLDETKKYNKRDRGGGVGRNGKGSSGGGGESDHEMYIWIERERRKKMRNLFSNLHALLPQLPPKADKSTIVDEVVKDIKTLQQTLQKLQKQKLERLQGSINFDYRPPMMTTKKQAFDSSREAFMSDQVSSSDLANIRKQISVCSPKKPGIFSTICYIWEKHKIEVISVHVSSESNRSMFMIQAHASTGASNQLSEAFQVEESFKQAAGEIMCWVSS